MDLDRLRLRDLVGDDPAPGEDDAGDDCLDGNGMPIGISSVIPPSSSMFGWTLESITLAESLSLDNKRDCVNKRKKKTSG